MSKSNKPLVSIIVAIYNGERYLQKCLASCLSQDYGRLEVILVDDGSEDGSGRMADEAAGKDGRVRVIHQENSGVSAARNRGLECARGEYICFVDQDDCISADYVSYFYSLICDYGAQIAYTPWADKFFDEIHEEKKKDETGLVSGIQAAEDMLYHKIIIGPFNKMIRRDLIDGNQIRFQTDFYNGEGFAFSIECFLHAERVAVGKRRVYHYRVGNTESGASKFRLPSIYSSINAQQYIKGLLDGLAPGIKEAWNFSNWHTHCDCLNMMVGCGVTKAYGKEYNILKNVCKKDAFCALKAPVSLQQRMRGILFKIHPYMAACIINCFRIRKFQVYSGGGGNFSGHWDNLPGCIGRYAYVY